MNKGLPNYKRAFFDTAEEPDLSFWNQGSPDLFANSTKTHEHAFYIRKYESHPPWQNCTLFLSGTYIVCKMVKEGFIY